MHWTQISENWPQVARQAERKWERLTVGDLAYIAGKKSDFVNRVHLRYGFSMLDAEEQVERWVRGLLLSAIEVSVDLNREPQMLESAPESTVSIRQAC